MEDVMTVPTIRPSGLIAKDPNSSVVYQFDWTDYLTNLGRTINTSTFMVTGSDAVLTTDNPSVITGDLKTQVRLLAGTAGVEYTLTNRIVTTGSPAVTDDRSILVFVQDQ
jgi:hypothetical protein